MITQSELKKHIHYNPATGEFTRLARSNANGVTFKPRKITNPQIITINNTRYSGAHIAYLYMTGKYPAAPKIMRINKNAADLRWANLKIPTLAEWRQHTQLKKPTQGGYYHKVQNKWQAAIRIKKKRHYLGTFDTRKEAEDAYQKAKELYHGTE